MVGANALDDGHALAAMGPQVDYYSPQIFVEYELHGGGIDATGVSFPGASPWPLIGHGIDFAWSGTSANGDNQDTFVERLCNPDGSPPTKDSTHYMYKGKCTPVPRARPDRDDPAPSPANMSRRRRSPTARCAPCTGRCSRSRRVGRQAGRADEGQGRRLPRARRGRSRSCTWPRTAPTDPSSFSRSWARSPAPRTGSTSTTDNAPSCSPGATRRTRAGTDVDLPYWRRRQRRLAGLRPLRLHVQAHPGLAPPAGGRPERRPIIISWNNKEAPGWRKGPTEWGERAGPPREILRTAACDRDARQRRQDRPDRR